MTKRLAFAAAFLIALCAMSSLVAIAQASPSKAEQASKKSKPDFAAREALIELKGMLAPYHASDGKNDLSSSWYVVTATNTAPRSATRVIQAGQPSNAAWRIFPRPTRPAVVQIASSESGAVIEPANAYGRRAFRVTLPPVSSVSIAIRVANADDPPSVFAWTEPALAAHNRQIAIFIAAVCGLIAAATAIAGGLAVMTGHAAPRWAAATLLLVLLTRLATAGMFDGSLATAVGGPYGLTALFTGLALAAGARLSDTIVPLADIWPQYLRHFRLGVIGLSILSVLAYLGVPATAILTDMLVVIGTTALAYYMVRRGRAGVQAARVAAPPAAVFALVTMTAAVTAMSGSGLGLSSPAIVGGFSAAGAVLLVLAVAAGEGIAMLPFPRHTAAHGPARRIVDRLNAARAAPVSAEPPAPLDPPHLMAAIEAIGASHQGVFDLDFSAQTILLSPEAAQMLDLEEAGIGHAEWQARIHAEDRPVYSKAMEDYRNQPGLAFRIEFRVANDNDRYSWFELRATMMGKNARADRCLGLLADVTMRKDAEAAVVDRSVRDSLTGLGNRVALMEELEQLGAKLSSAMIALIDIDRFKAIHASLGDEGGDTLLSKIAERLTKRFSSEAEIFRVGGDAFGLLFTHSRRNEADLGADIVDACAAPYAQNDRNVFANASVGVASGKDARDPLDFLKNAELALGEAKRAGGNAARFYSPEMDAEAPGDSVALEADLRRALEEDELDLHYQPIVRLSDGSIAGFEGLLRWNHPTRGLVSPAEFIAHSEATGLILALGRFAVARAAHDLADWQRFFPLDPPLFASVNVSRRQLRDAGFESFLRETIAGAALQNGTLKLEITESAVMGGEDSKDRLKRLRSLGLGLAIDDFGTGLSNLSQLKDIPFDTIKIDKSFLTRHGGTEPDTDGEVVLASIVSLAHELKRSVVVEGVETERDALWLAALGCEYAQGYHFSPALPLADALSFIALHYETGTEQRETAGEG
jgi:diguanylate cyclase (GGDEF)-like protein